MRGTYNVSLESLHLRRAAVLYNPVARGLARHRYSLQRTIGILAQQGINARLVPTLAPGSASFQAKEEIQAGCDLILAAGGDGTINEVANGMLHSNVPLGILPGGTANVLAREMRLSMHPERVASQIRTYKRQKIAAGTLRLGDSAPRGFFCMAGVGLDADIISRLNLDLKAAYGKLAYYIGGFSQVLRSLPEFDVIVDGVVYQASFALISRVRNYGGDLEIARGASLLRKDFEVVLFRGTLAVRYLPYFFGVALRRVHRMAGCTVLYGKSVSCQHSSGEPVYAQVDGELAGKVPMKADVAPDALTLLVSPDYLAREQSHVAAEVCA